MTAHDLLTVSKVACLLLLIWELLKHHWGGAILSAVAGAVLLRGPQHVNGFLSALLVVPIVFEERWHPQTRKDMMRVCLAAGIIGTNLALLIVY
ncbi:MAG: hypothetical protein V1694_01120 [Candidatus Eisenbacteria bacterium]